MFRVLVRKLDTEKYEELAGVRYKSREEAEEAVKHTYVQVRRGGEYIIPEEFKIEEAP